MELFEIAVRIAELGLIVYENYDNQEIDIARPASVEGSMFRGWNEVQVSAIGTTLLTTNAPSVKVTISGKGRKAKYLVNISMTAAPGPGPEWFNEEFKYIEEVIEAVKGCYFSDRVNSKNLSLEIWFGQREQ